MYSKHHNEIAGTENELLDYLAVKSHSSYAPVAVFWCFHYYLWNH